MLLVIGSLKLGETVFEGDRSIAAALAAALAAHVDLVVLESACEMVERDLPTLPNEKLFLTV